MNLDILDIWNIRENKDFFHVATHGLEGLANLQNTMLDNGLQWVGSSCSSKQGSSWRWVGSRVGGHGICRRLSGKPTFSC